MLSICCRFIAWQPYISNGLPVAISKQTVAYVSSHNKRSTSMADELKIQKKIMSTINLYSLILSEF